MSDNNKFGLYVGYVQLNILKHALQFYLTREGAAEQDKAEERSLLNKIEEKTNFIKDKYRIKSIKKN